MIIYLIRHGETTGDIEGRYGGSYDDNLTDNGQIQAKQLIQEIKGTQIIYHSPLKRAKQTAKIIQTHQTLIEVKNIRERNAYGILSGLTKEEAKKKHPTEHLKTHVDNIQGSESHKDFEPRVLKAFRKILKTNKDIAIITHGGVIRFLMKQYFNKRVNAGNCEIIKIEYKDDNFKLI